MKRYNKGSDDVEFYAKLFDFDYDAAGVRIARVKYTAENGEILTMFGKIDSMFKSTSTELIEDDITKAKLMLIGL